ncbi:MAG: flippase-like domain-containing protein [Clostridia bacterium]|nr:flippase-like domain-containing protein [Clostridia bacterium]
MKNSSTKKMVRNFILFALLIVLTLWIMLKDQDPAEIFQIIGQSNGLFIIVGIICMVVYIILEAVNIRRTLKILGNKIKFKSSIKYALIGFFFSGITPAASGGQPMQIYYMHKDGLSVGHSTLALLINLTSMQIVTISVALVSVLFNYKYLNKMMVILLVVGLLLNVIALMILLIAIFSKRLSRFLMKVTIRIMKFFRVKNMDKKIKKIGRELGNYQRSAKYIKKNKKLMVRIVLTTLIQFLLNYSVAYWTYRALGFDEHSILEIVTMQSVLFATVSGIPSPGSVGVSEGAFVAIFTNIYPENMIKSATLLNRGINFYLFMLISGILVAINQIREKKNVEEV